MKNKYYFVISQFPPISAAISTITDPLLIFETASLNTIFGAFFPGINAVVIIISTSFAISFIFIINKII